MNFPGVKNPGLNFPGVNDPGVNNPRSIYVYIYTLSRSATLNPLSRAGEGGGQSWHPDRGGGSRGSLIRVFESDYHFSICMMYEYKITFKH